ncbi:phospholipid/cholesterol/gamma-HCH transport system substrate-binding protein [Stackebrandtia albiflava]|uniref:Phospholipid/cholesterol/gamma-HCH transport system substrate-binding protein n=1 Tax=Stackebrandtia albiflava TaxID=406432 RepID=A0A562V3A6_9ACTN|nr:MCE family protein [Stackebrandtia albiflava]TWJ12333.1 phospholipid/cholesterol/gamma-HCH transport system substrate-binding protein [Stackebrandtia albiflava]
MPRFGIPRRRRDRPPRTRNLKRTGAVTLVVALIALLGAFQLDDLLLLAGGHSYTAQLRDAAGLTPGTEVRVAGVKVGKVTTVELAGLGTREPHVAVDFRIEADVLMGDETRASVRLKTLLGQRYLSIEPAGSGSLDGDVIPLSRTATPLDVVDAVNNLAGTFDEIDTDQLAEAMRTLSETFADTGDEFGDSLEGLSALSQTLASRDEELGDLLASARTVTDVLAERDDEFARLVADGNLLLGEVSDRKDAIRELLSTTVWLSEELQGLVDDQDDRLGPALDRLSEVVTLLQDNQENLEHTLTTMGPFIKAFSNVLGNGRWFDSYIEGLLQPYQVEPNS